MRGINALGRRIQKQVFNSELLNTIALCDYSKYDSTDADDTSNPKDALLMVVGPPAVYIPWREYAYGPEHFDELVVEFDSPGETRWPVLQDVNHNVVGLVDLEGHTHIEHSFSPYGEWDALHYTVGSGSPGQTIDPDDGVDDQYEAPWSSRGYHSYFYDPETGFWYALGRYVIPPLARFASADPIGTGLVYVTSPVHSGMAMRPSAWVRPHSQYTDSNSPYEFVRSNPITRNDPMGLFSLTETLSTSATYATQAYSWYSTASDVAQMAQALANGASLRDVALDFVVNVAADAAFGKALDIASGAGAKLLGQFSEGFRKGARKGEEELAKVRARAHEKPMQDHHFVARGEKRFIKRFNKTLNKYGLDVDSPELPVINMHHQGRHPTEYLKLVEQLLQQADRYAQGNRERFLAALHDFASVVGDSPEILMKDYWR